MANKARGFIIAAPHSGSGKTLISLGLCRALLKRGIRVAPAKSGPDYIDRHYLSKAAQCQCVNLDAWGMSEARLGAIAAQHAHNGDVLIVEGVMGLFDGGQDGTGATADLAVALGLPVVLVIDASHMAQSVAAIAHGLMTYRDDVVVAGVVLNRVASDKHEGMLRAELEKREIACFGVIRRDTNLSVPSRHLGLVLPEDVADIDAKIEAAAQAVSRQIDLDVLLDIATPVAQSLLAQRLVPLGQNIAIAKDSAFSFYYEHFLQDWQAQGANISFFSPLADEAPDPHADAIFLPGGYPELHGETLAHAAAFKAALHMAKDKGTLIYGECGGYMVLGETLTDNTGKTHQMAGLLPHSSHIDQPRRVLGYRRLRNLGPLPFTSELLGHEFHYSSQIGGAASPLFDAQNAVGDVVGAMGCVNGRVCGSYAHVIDGIG